ncbi:hypothetical protein GQS52_10200 [Streptomyces sp. SCUT-3]|uniref:hypothetical protein n=1 Tax=Streptomyces TaxID=1883 RepID=UPI0015FBD848|nr:hypothetical protein [Streptomyces sp. SCUT-3]QMV22092.1 hypothetical protein GQS52_10200 [Streptomyces sp. SCUT-3]
MTAVLRLPAAVRLPRTPAARRALLVAVFLGGLLALAFALAGSARAAGTGTEQVAPPAGHLLREAEEAGGEAGDAEASDGLAEAGTEAGDTVEQGVDLAEDSVEGGRSVRDGAERALEPVARHTDPVTGPVVEPVTDLVEDATGISVDLPVGGERPGRTPPTGGDGDGSAARPGPHGPEGSARHADAEPHAQRPCTDLQHTVPAAPEPHAAGGDHGRDLDGRSHDRAPQQSPHAPSGHTSHNAGDNNGPRGGDVNGTLTPAADRFGPTAGGVRDTGARPTRERAGEILEFPA